MFNKFTTDTAMSRELASAPIPADAALVLLKLMLRMNKMNLVKGRPGELADRMGITGWEFKKGVKLLKSKDFIRKYTKWEYMLNPDIIFNGEDRKYYIVKHMWDTQTLGQDRREQ